jgi:hypothetical protein
MIFPIAKKILDIADELDNLGLYSEANELTMLVRTAQMPGGANPAAGYAQPAPKTPPPVSNQQNQTSLPDLKNWQQEIDKITGQANNTANNFPSPMSPTSYNGPVRPYDPRYNPANNNAYNSWYNPVVNPANNTQNLQNQLSNMAVAPIATVTNGKPQQSITMQDYMNQALTNSSNAASNASSEEVVKNARQLQIQKEMQEAQARYWKLWQEQQAQLNQR